MSHSAVLTAVVIRKFNGVADHEVLHGVIFDLVSLHIRNRCSHLRFKLLVRSRKVRAPLNFRLQFLFGFAVIMVELQEQV